MPCAVVRVAGKRVPRGEVGHGERVREPVSIGALGIPRVVEIDAVVPGGDHDERPGTLCVRERLLDSRDRGVKAADREVDDLGAVGQRQLDATHDGAVGPVSAGCPAHHLHRQHLRLRRDSDIASVSGRRRDHRRDHGAVAGDVGGVVVAIICIPAGQKVGRQVVVPAIDARVDHRDGHAGTAGPPPDGQHVERGDSGRRSARTPWRRRAGSFSAARTRSSVRSRAHRRCRSARDPAGSSTSRRCPSWRHQGGRVVRFPRRRCACAAEARAIAVRRAVSAAGESEDHLEEASASDRLPDSLLPGSDIPRTRHDHPEPRAGLRSGAQRAGVPTMSDN